MLWAWWRRRAARTTTTTPARANGQTADAAPLLEPIPVGGPRAEPVPVALYGSCPELPEFRPEDWVRPLDPGWLAADEDVPFAFADEAAEPPAEEPVPFFAFDDAGAPGTRPWRSEGWWLRAEPKLKRRVLVAMSKLAPALLRAWIYTTPEPPRPRVIDRIALLAGLRGRFDPDQVAGLLARRPVRRAA
jgi:hypothetical protein